MGNQSSGALSKQELKELETQTKFTHEELQQLWQAFKKADKNKSGDLDQQEFQTLLKSHLKDITSETLLRLFRTMDTDNNGRVSFRELAVSLSIVGKGTPTEKLTFMFNVFDEDKNGRLTANEIQKIVAQMKQVAVALGRNEKAATEFLNAVMNKLDKNKDGTISLQEFVEGGLHTPSVLVLLGTATY